MTFDAAMRIGSLEIAGALALFGVVVSRLRPAEARSGVKEMAVHVRVQAIATARTVAREVEVRILEGTPCTIGRSPQAGLELADPEVSRRHARIDLVRGILYLSDEGSSNGTFLNGKALADESIELRPGDDIDVGNTRITISGTEPGR